jgi:hypothetical protein
VLLREARDLAASVGDTKTITAAAEKMAEAYEISRPAALLPGFQAALKAPLPPAAANDIAETCLSSSDEAIAADDYDTASRCMAMAEQVARLARDAGLSSRVAERVASVRTLRASHQRALAALQKLKTDHNNPSLNLVAGKFYCLDKGDWESGLPFLARGSDPELKELAALDLKGTQKPAAEAALGDRYWQAAAHASGPAKPALQNRARYWYGKAMPAMDGLEKVRLRERLDTDPVWKLHDMIQAGRPAGAAHTRWRRNYTRRTNLHVDRVPRPGSDRRDR